ncbi:ABC transporter substrate-binding protein [Kaistia defluvii]|uniref:ABC transporter substrate-binding protein n=1 Tax=Kaistia defluvii TaxID=410841 RepID=UPI0022503F22|nr:ABC transporter substrate-binding protein [Kaistia defluvii]MCX5521061.1 ABC transporter substrate-binding protein [Kaistia defluvii]
MAAWALAGPALAEAPPVDAPKRIVSINACADQLLLALADPAQIAALSLYATDPAYSYLAEQAKAFPHDAGAAETVIQRDPDLVLAGRFTKRETRSMLKRLGFKVVELDTVKSIDDSIAQIRDVAALLGHPERGNTLIARIEAARAKATAGVPAGSHPPTVAVYQRRGYVTGQNTLTGELLRLAGFADMGGQLAGKTGGFVPLERIVTDRPDMLVVADAQTVAADQGSALLAHPALRELYPPERRIALPGRLTICAGPSLPEAIETLAAERAKLGGS